MIHDQDPMPGDFDEELARIDLDDVQIVEPSNESSVSRPHDWELLHQVAARPREADLALLRGLLADALSRRGHASMLAGESSPGGEHRPVGFPTVFSLVVIWAIGVWSAQALGLPVYLWPLGVIAAIVFLGFVARLVGDSPVFGLAVVTAWAVIGVLNARSGVPLLAATHLVPVALALTYALASRTLRLREAQDLALATAGVVRSAPLVGPVVLLVLFVPALDSDVWELANQLDAWAFLTFAALSVGLLSVVVRVQLGNELEVVLHQRAQRLGEVADRGDQTRRQAWAALDQDGREILNALPDETLDNAWPTAGQEYAPYLTAAEGRVLQRPLTARLTLTVVAVALLLGLYLYLLCSAVVPSEIAERWVSSPVETADLSLLGLTVTLKLGAYLKLAGLLGLAATASFLSFAVVEERFASALTDALLRDPADRFLVLALPYLRAHEERLSLAADDHVPSVDGSS